MGHSLTADFGLCMVHLWTCFGLSLHQFEFGRRWGLHNLSHEGTSLLLPAVATGGMVLEVGWPLFELIAAGLKCDHCSRFNWLVVVIVCYCLVRAFKHVLFSL